MADVTNNFYIKGNYIDKQYIATQNIHLNACPTIGGVDRVPATDTDFEDVTRTTPDSQKSRKQKNGKTVSPKQSPHFYDTPPLVYKYKGESFNETKRLTILFQYLCKEYEPTKTWIYPATNPDDFLSLFSGTNSSAVIVWTAPKQRLFGLFKRMKERKIITPPKGYGLWQIVQNHFSDWHGNMFQDFNKEHMPQEPVYSAIEAFVDILDPACTTNADLDEYAKNIGKTFGKR